MQMYDIWSILCYKNENAEGQIVSCSKEGSKCGFGEES